MNTLVYTINSDNPRFLTMLKGTLDKTFGLADNIKTFSSEILLDDKPWGTVAYINEWRERKGLPIIPPFKEETE